MTDIKRFEQVGDQYSKAVRRGGTVYLAGLIAEDWSKDMTGQAEDIFAQIDHLLAEAGSDKSQLLTIMVHITSFDDYAAFKTAYAAWVDQDNLPARATVKSELLDPALKLEIIATAQVK